MVTTFLAMSIFTMSAFSPNADSASQTHVLAKHAFSLADRYSNASVNEVFKDNIWLTLQYLQGSVPGKNISWNTITKPFIYSFTLEPQQTFAFHPDILPQYKQTLAQTTHADFSEVQGFKSDGYLYGDGVCHLASLINWTAKDAGLTVYAPTKHNFAMIPDIPKKYGVAIYDAPNQLSASEQQNLYITNNQAEPVNFTFDYQNNTLSVTASENF